MKINITFLPDNQIDYTNYSIVANQGNVQLTHVDAGECEEVLALNVIEYLPRHMVQQILQDWVSKLAHKGKITVNFTDVYTVSRLFFLQQFGINEYNVLVHGEMTKGWDEKKTNYTLPQVAQLMESLGLKVTKKKLDGVIATLIAERP